MRMIERSTAFKRDYQHIKMIETTFLLPGPVGDLEVLTTPPANDSFSAVAIICHPHPLHGGTMNNKVVSTLAKNMPRIRLTNSQI